MSEPSAMGTSPAATAQALPDDDPPQVRDSSHGFLLAPNTECSPEAPIANSSRLALPTTIAPALISRWAAVAVKGER